jgi:hypothetical protein
MAIFGVILVAACLFLLYALAKFHAEAARPRPRARHNGVIMFRKIDTQQRGTSDAAQAQRSGESDPTEGLAQPLPFGVRRLAVKRAARR